MVMWKGLAVAGMVSAAAIIAASWAPAGAGSREAAPAAALIELAQNEAAGAATTAETPAATEPPAGEDAPAAEGAPAADATAEEAAPAEGEEEVAVFTPEFLNDPVHQEAGKVVWETCAGCHGARAYPGKAPKLRPKRYTPEFVFDRVTNGYKKMPAWKDVFTKEERMAVVAYILSEDFTP